MMTSLRREIKVQNKLGLHARPAAMLVQTVGRFKCELTVTKEDMTVNAKSIMGVMMLAAECGSTLALVGEGEDAGAAMDAVEELFARKFDEGE
ncbi:HPr family phosphocarrier protein [bacterium]|nr:HPr family phosphocarrier protein [bacterium]